MSHIPPPPPTDRCNVTSSEESSADSPRCSSLEVAEANLSDAPAEQLLTEGHQTTVRPPCMTLAERADLQASSGVTQEEQQQQEQPAPQPNTCTRIPPSPALVLTSGQEIDAKNTLRSNSVLRPTIATTSTPRTASPNLYKEMLGISTTNCASRVGGTVRTTSIKESTSSLFAQSNDAISAIAYSSTTTSHLATNGANATSISAMTETNFRTATHQTSVTPLNVLTVPIVASPHDVSPVFARACFVENETCGQVLPLQSISPDSMTYVSNTNSRVSGLTEASAASAGGTKQIPPLQSKTGLCMGVVALVVVLTSAIILGTVCGSGYCSPNKETVLSASKGSVPDTPNRATTVAEWINRLTLSGRTIAVLTDTSSQRELPEELALRWIIQDDPLALQPTDATSRFRLQQRYALYTLLAQMPRLDETSRDALPTASMDECEWLGVTCTTLEIDGVARNVVTTIALPSRQLSGSLPADLGLLKEVLHFDVSYNSLSGSLPEEIDQWTRLETLHLGYNQVLTGSIPSSFGTQWTNLRNFSVPGNALTGSIPSELEAWTLLTHFNVQNNIINGTIPSFRWSNLEYFAMRDNKLVGTIPAQIGEHWTSLQHFDVGWSYAHLERQNFISGTLPHTLQQLSALRYFNANGNNIKGTLPEWLGRWTSLEVFDVHQNIGFTGTLPLSCGEAWSSSMRYFDVNNNVLEGSIPESYSQWSRLEYFDVNDNGLTGTLSESWAQWTDLRVLSVWLNRLTGTIPSVWGSTWPKLEQLEMAFNELNGTLPESIGNWSSLQSFWVSDNELSGSIPSTIGQWTALWDMFGVDRNGLTGTLPDSIGQWSLLSFFSVAFNGLTGTIPDSIASWRHIETAYFEANNFTDAMPEGLCDTNVTELVADCNGEVSCSCCTSCIAREASVARWGEKRRGV